MNTAYDSDRQNFLLTMIVDPHTATSCPQDIWDCQCVSLVYDLVAKTEKF